MLVAVTGAGGKTGAALVDALIDAGHQVRPLFHRDRQAEVPHVVGDVRDEAVIDRLLWAVHAVVHVPPNLHDDEEGMADALVAGCVRHGVRRLVYHSVLHPQTSAMPHHWQKLRVEERLLTSGLDVTFVQPAPYTQNLLPYLETDEPLFPYPPSTTFSMVDLRDVAEATAQLLDDPDAVGGAFPLVGEARTSQGEAWARVSGGRPFTHVDREEWLDRQGLTGRARDWLGAMFAFYVDHGLVGSPFALRAVLGRAPRTVDALTSAR